MNRTYWYTKFKTIGSSLFLVSSLLFAHSSLAAEESTAPILAYDDNVQSLARDLMRPGFLVRGQFSNVRRRVEKWQELSTECIATGDESICTDFASATRTRRTNAHDTNCSKLVEWSAEKAVELREEANEAGQQNSILAQATEAAIAQLEFEIGSLCDYQHLLVIDNAELAEFVSSIRAEMPNAAPYYAIPRGRSRAFATGFPGVAVNPN